MADIITTTICLIALIIFLYKAYLLLEVITKRAELVTDYNMPSRQTRRRRQVAQAQARFTEEMDVPAVVARNQHGLQVAESVSERWGVAENGSYNARLTALRPRTHTVTHGVYDPFVHSDQPEEKTVDDAHQRDREITTDLEQRLITAQGAFDYYHHELQIEQRGLHVHDVYYEENLERITRARSRALIDLSQVQHEIMTRMIRETPVERVDRLLPLGGNEHGNRFYTHSTSNGRLPAWRSATQPIRAQEPPPTQNPIIFSIPPNLSDRPVDEHTTEVGLACIICCVHIRNILLSPCGHTQTCLACTKRLTERSGGLVCPICKKACTQVHGMYI